MSATYFLNLNGGAAYTGTSSRQVWLQWHRSTNQQSSGTGNRGGVKLQRYVKSKCDQTDMWQLCCWYSILSWENICWLDLKSIELDLHLYMQALKIGNKLGLSCAKLTPQLSSQLAKLSTRTSWWLATATAWAGWFAELLWARLNASCVQNKLSRVGVVGLYENKANSARPAGTGARAWLSLAKLQISPRKSVKNVWDYLPREFYLQFHLLIRYYH